MAITRTTTTTIAAATINDEYGVDLTIHRGSEKLTRALTTDEAMQLAAELTAAAVLAQRAATEDGAS